MANYNTYIFCQNLQNTYRFGEIWVETQCIASDEWQEQPEIWNYVRHEVDKRKLKGVFILTGSANPPENASLHSGAGRFTVLQMDTMTWQELGYSSGTVKMSDWHFDLGSGVNDFPRKEEGTEAIDLVIHAAGLAHRVPKTEAEKQQFFILMWRERGVCCMR